MEAQKAEMVKIALEKLKEANIKKVIWSNFIMTLLFRFAKLIFECLLKLIVKAYTDDGCAKTVIIDETMKVYDIMLILLNKNHFQPTTNYAVVEYLPKFNMSKSRFL